MSSRLMAVLQTAAFPFSPLHRSPILVGSGRNRTSCPKGPRLQRGDGTSLSLWHFPLLVIWLRAPGSHRAAAAYETAWVPNRPARINAAEALTSSLAAGRSKSLAAPSVEPLMPDS